MLTSVVAGPDVQNPSCKECHGRLLFAEDTGEQVCTVCGTVGDSSSEPISLSIQDAATIRNSTTREQPTSRMMYVLNLPTVIGSENFDAGGKRIQGGYELSQLRRWNKYTISGEPNRSNEVRAMFEIEQIVGSVGLPASVAREACEIYHRGLRKRAVKSRSISGMAAAAVLVACYIVGASCAPDEIERLKKTANGNFIRHYHKLFLRNMNLKVTVADPSRDVSRIAAKAGVDGPTERRSLEILSRIKGEPTLAGKRTASVAAAALSIASIQMGVHQNQMRLALAAGITPITLRKRKADISAILGRVAQTALPDPVIRN
jgi:transcription initiation factor TFIIB